jgi:hypothetical protein
LFLDDDPIQIQKIPSVFHNAFRIDFNFVLQRISSQENIASFPTSNGQF